MLELPSGHIGGLSVAIAHFMEAIHIQLADKGRHVRMLEVLR